MKKTIILTIIIIIFIIITNSVKQDLVKIPKEAIRIRVLANSNDNYDQEMKKQVKELVANQLYPKLNNIKNINEARKVINNNIDNIEKNIDTFFTQKKYNQNYEVIYGLNYFPEKEYKGVYYDEGYYESLLVTIGDGSGDNWWCVLFPPLCLMEAEESEEVEYKFFVQELIDKYF